MLGRKPVEKIGESHCQSIVLWMGDVLIPTLMIGDCSERICVRVSRFWDFFDPHDETKLLHTDLVLIDEEGNSVHAQIYPRLDEQFKPLIKEGGVYNISYFRVKKSSKYRPVPNDSMIIFTRRTLVEEVVEIPPAFPVCTYSLTPMEQLQSRVDCNDYFTDIIGAITMISNVSTLRARSRQADSLKRTITIGSAGATVDVVLWGERAKSFPGEQVHKDGLTSPQIVIFVGTLVKRFADTVSLTGGSACKWYINPEVPEAKSLMARVRSMHEPIKWDEHMTSGEPKVTAEPKKVSDIKYLHPFKNKKKEFLVTVTVRKIDNAWWYNSCSKCLRTSKPHGDSFRCSGPDCGTIGAPTQRYKLCIVAGHETGDTEFILFGRKAQRLTKKTVDTLIADNPRGFIPDEITRLLEKVYIWNVSFTENTIGSGNVCFQVNAIIGEIDASNALLPTTPTGSQSSSYMLSQGEGSSMQNTPQKSAPLALPSPPATSEASHASSTTPGKAALLAHEPPVTPQSAIDTTKDEVAQGRTLLQTEAVLEPISAVAALARSSATPQDSGGANVLKKPASDVCFGDSTKSRGSVTGKRSRSSPKKGTAKRLFKDDIARDDDGGACADDTAETGSAKNA